MEQRLRLVQGGHQSRGDKRASERRRVEVSGQIVWKDARGNTKLTSVVTRDVSEYGVSVECLNGAAIPLYRLVYFQIDREARHRADLPWMIAAHPAGPNSVTAAMALRTDFVLRSAETVRSGRRTLSTVRGWPSRTGTARRTRWRG